jgi:hypothetical protein
VASSHAGERASARPQRRRRSSGTPGLSDDRTSWTYDALSRLTRERRSGTNAYDLTYTYDPADEVA